jgi:hypothetical protein
VPQRSGSGAAAFAESIKQPLHRRRADLLTGLISPRPDILLGEEARTVGDQVRERIDCGDDHPAAVRDRRFEAKIGSSVAQRQSRGA